MVVEIEFRALDDKRAEVIRAVIDEMVSRGDTIFNRDIVATESLLRLNLKEKRFISIVRREVTWCFRLRGATQYSKKAWIIKE
ncbi:MAG: hypothetical protein WC936_07050 [Candidatus Nanoarchaeia archaeon]|jgi:hypothetical protein